MSQKYAPVEVLLGLQSSKIANDDMAAIADDKFFPPNFLSSDETRQVRRRLLPQGISV